MTPDDPPINEAYIQDTETRLRREIELMRKREDHLWNDFQVLRAESERLKALINNKQYIKLLADYNRGHLSHYNWLKEQDGGIRE